MLNRLSIDNLQVRQALVDYVNATATVSGFAYGLYKTQLAVLLQPPPGYADFAERLAAAKIHVSAWINGLVPAFGLVPAALVSANLLIQGHLADLEQLLETSQVREALNAVMAFWQVLLTAIDDILADLTEAGSVLADPGRIDEAIQAARAARKSWDDAAEFAREAQRIVYNFEPDVQRIPSGDG
jgi:hypothetical protein